MLCVPRDAPSRHLPCTWHPHSVAVYAGHAPPTTSKCAILLQHHSFATLYQYRNSYLACICALQQSNHAMWCMHGHQTLSAGPWRNNASMYNITSSNMCATSRSLHLLPALDHQHQPAPTTPLRYRVVQGSSPGATGKRPQSTQVHTTHLAAGPPPPVPLPLPRRPRTQAATCPSRRDTLLLYATLRTLKELYRKRLPSQQTLLLVQAQFSSMHG